MEIALAHRITPLRERRHHGADDLRPRLLVRLVHEADADLERWCFAVVTLKRLSGKSMSYGGSRSQIARITSIASANILLRSSSSMPSASASEVSAPGLMPKMKRPLARWSNIAACAAISIGCDCERFEVPVRELDVLGLGDQRRQEHHAVGDVLGLVGQVLADEGVVEAELVGEDDGLAVLLQRLGPVAVQRDAAAW